MDLILILVKVKIGNELHVGAFRMASFVNHVLLTGLTVAQTISLLDLTWKYWAIWPITAF